MSILIYGLLNSRLVGTGFTLAFGIGLILIALVCLYGELRAVFTDASSFATDPDEPMGLRLFRRLCGWLLIVAGLTIGPFAVYVALHGHL